MRYIDPDNTWSMADNPAVALPQPAGNTNNLKAWLAEREITQERLADMLGYTQPTVSRVLNSEPTRGFLWRFEHTFGQTATAEAFGTNGKEKEPA